MTDLISFILWLIFIYFSCKIPYIERKSQRHVCLCVVTCSSVWFFLFVCFCFFWLISLGRGMCVMGSVEDILKEEGVSCPCPLCTSFRDQTWVVTLGGKCLYLLSHPADSTWSFLNKISSETLILGRENLTLHIETPMKYVHLVKVKIYRPFKKQIKERGSSNQC